MASRAEHARALMVSSLRACIAATATVVGASLLDEWVDFRKFDATLGLNRGEEAEDELLWRTTHPPGASSAVCNVRAENERTMELAVRASLTASERPADAFHIVRSDSAVQSGPAGFGAHIVGASPRGSILTYFHGPIYTPILGRLSLLVQMIVGSEDRRAEFDAVQVLADSSLIKGLHGPGLGSNAQGAQINHPPPGVEPNALFVDVFADEAAVGAEAAAELRRLNPDAAPRPFRTRAPGRARLRTVAIVALRDVRDEELLVDYGYTTGSASIPDGDGSAAPLPGWYSAVRRP